MFFTTNTAEGYFSILKRGIIGIHHVAELTSINICASSTRAITGAGRMTTRAGIATKKTSGKRLMLKSPNPQPNMA